MSALDICLTARALGASEIMFTRGKEARIARYMNSLEREWGGTFKVSFNIDYRKAMAEANNYMKVYLTRYGVPLNKLIYQIKTYKNIMLIVSSIKASSLSMHRIADFNASVTDQPHCSAAAIAIFLHEFYEGRELAVHFENSKYKVIPKEHGINVETIARK